MGLIGKGNLLVENDAHIMGNLIVEGQINSSIIHQTIGNDKVWKFSDGTMIQTHVYHNDNESLTLQWGAAFYNVINFGNWAEPFVDDDFTIISALSRADFGTVISRISNSSRTAVGVGSIFTFNSTQGAVSAYITAIGRWK